MLRTVDRNEILAHTRMAPSDRHTSGALAVLSILNNSQSILPPMHPTHYCIKSRTSLLNT